MLEPDVVNGCIRAHVPSLSIQFVSYQIYGVDDGVRLYESPYYTVIGRWWSVTPSSPSAAAARSNLPIEVQYNPRHYGLIDPKGDSNGNETFSHQ